MDRRPCVFGRPMSCPLHRCRFQRFALGRCRAPWLVGFVSGHRWWARRCMSHGSIWPILSLAGERYCPNFSRLMRVLRPKSNRRLDWERWRAKSKRLASMVDLKRPQDEHGHFEHPVEPSRWRRAQRKRRSFCARWQWFLGLRAKLKHLLAAAPGDGLKSKRWTFALEHRWAVTWLAMTWRISRCRLWPKRWCWDRLRIARGYRRPHRLELLWFQSISLNWQPLHRAQRLRWTHNQCWKVRRVG